MRSYSDTISGELSLEKWQVSNVLSLLDESATIPFIARYRKEKTGSLDEVQLLEIQKLQQKLSVLEDRRQVILKSIQEQGYLTDELNSKILAADSISLLEDIYLPFKPKRKTRSSIAIEKGLEPLAKMIMSENLRDLNATANGFVSEKFKVNSVEEALQGARDIIAEWINERGSVRNSLRKLFQREAILSSKVSKGKDEEGINYKSYFNWEELANRAPSHRILAMLRGEKEGFLKIKMLPDKEKAIENVSKYLVKGTGETSDQKVMAVKDAVSRLLFPSLETELRNRLKQNADESAVGIFSENLRQLLLTPPLGQKNVLAIDPGFRTGCKIVCLDRNGQLQNNGTIFPHPPQRETAMAVKKLKSLVNAYKIEAIAIGNGTAGRETEDVLMRAKFDRDLTLVMVNESGASVYSASKVARDEFPEYDVTVRGAVSIGRRLMDPLAELVKIDPKAIGVGQYQHDVDQKMLQDSLETTVGLCVNSVGVELNTTSKELLSNVSGIGNKLAAQIILFRNENGNFKSRNDLKKVKGMGEKSFQQSAGFLRIKDGINPLDGSAVHPEHYNTVKKMATGLKVEVSELIGSRQLIAKINPQDYITGNIGLPTIQDILSELEKPGRDPRKVFKAFSFNKDIRTINDIKQGMKLPAIVTNLTAFGAFVDLGIHESGLIHKSQIADEFVSDPKEYLKINQQIQVKVLEIDIGRKRIALSLINL